MYFTFKMYLNLVMYLILVVWQKCDQKERNLEKISALGFLVPLEAEFYVD